MGAAGAGAGGVGGREDAAFADGDDVAGKLRDEALAEGEVGFEDGEVAVVDADDGGAVGDGAFEFGFVMNFEQRVEASGVGGGMEDADFVIGEGANDDEDGAGAGFAGLEHLDRVDHEILAEAGARGGRVAEVGGDAAEVVERAAEVFFVGEDGEGVGAGGLVALGLLEGGGAGFDVAGGRRAALDFGDDGEGAVGAAKGVEEGRRPRQGGVEAGELGFENGADERRNFAALVLHDLGEFVGGHGGPRNTRNTLKTKPKKFPCIPRVPWAGSGQ